MAVELRELMAAARELVAQDAVEATSHFISREFLRRSVNRHARRLWNMIAARNPAFFLASHTIVFEPGRTVYALPSDFGRLRVALISDGSAVDPLEPFDELEDLAEIKRHEIAGTPSLADFRYGLRGFELEIRPKPGTDAATYSVELRFQKRLRTLEKDEDPLQLDPGMEDYIVFGAAGDATLRDGEDASPYYAMQRGIGDDLDALIGTRDEARPARVRVVTRRRRRSPLEV